MYEFVKAEGIYLYDKEGRAYIDLISGIAVNNIGHRHPRVVQAIHHQTDRYLHQMVYGEYIIGPQVELAQKLDKRCPENINAFYFVNSGSEAVEGAIKLSRAYTGKHKLVAMRNAYHGSSTGALSLMSAPYYSGPFKPLLPEVYFANLNDEDSLRIITPDTAAVFIETVQAESGYRVADDAFLAALQELAHKNGALIIADEIQSGIKRTGTFWSFENSPLRPDIILSAKGLGGGMPIGMFASSREIMSSLSRDPVLGHITTFGGHPVSCAAALACIEVVEEITAEEILEKEQVFREKLVHPLILNITGKGLMLSIQLKNFEQVDLLIRDLFQQGLIIDWFLYANNCLRIAPPLTISKDQIGTVCQMILAGLDRL